jgi:hypothetical protein
VACRPGRDPLREDKERGTKGDKGENERLRRSSAPMLAASATGDMMLPTDIADTYEDK